MTSWECTVGGERYRVGSVQSERQRSDLLFVSNLQKSQGHAHTGTSCLKANKKNKMGRHWDMNNYGQCSELNV